MKHIKKIRIIKKHKPKSIATLYGDVRYDKPDVHTLGKLGLSKIKEVWE